MIKDLTVGKPSITLWKFSLALFASAVFQQLYNISDTVIAGKYAGETALSAVGISYPITMIFMAIAFGCNIGSSVVISKIFGSKDYTKLRTTISTTFISASILSVVLTAIGISCSTLFLNMVKTPQSIFEQTALYYKIYMWGFPFLFMYNITNAIFTALGDSKTPLIFLIISSLANIGLDLLFVAVFEWGVAGAAWATFIAQGISCILSALVLIRRLKQIPSPQKSPVFSWNLLRNIAIVALPSVLQQSFVSIGNIFIQGLVNGYGDFVIAGYSAAIKLNIFTITSIMTLANGISSFTAQNIGAGKFDRVKQGYYWGVLLTFIITIPFFVAYFFFPEPLIKLFMKEQTPDAVQTGVRFLKIVSPFYFVALLKISADGILRGASAMKFFMITTFADLIGRVALAFVFTPIMGVDGIWWSWPIGWIIGMTLSLIFYFTGVWKPKEMKLPTATTTEQ